MCLGMLECVPKYVSECVTEYVPKCAESVLEYVSECARVYDGDERRKSRVISPPKIY